MNKFEGGGEAPPPLKTMMRLKILRAPFRRDPEYVWLAWKKAGASVDEIIDVDNDIAETLIDWRLAKAVKVEVFEQK